MTDASRSRDRSVRTPGDHELATASPRSGRDQDRTRSARFSTMPARLPQHEFVHPKSGGDVTLHASTIKSSPVGPKASIRRCTGKAFVSSARSWWSESSESRWYSRSPAVRSPPTPQAGLHRRGPRRRPFPRRHRSLRSAGRQVPGLRAQLKRSWSRATTARRIKPTGSTFMLMAPSTPQCSVR